MYSKVDILNFITILLPIIFAGLLLFENKKEKRVMGFLMISFSFFIFLNSTSVNNIINISSGLKFFSFVFLFAIPPTFYIYTRLLIKTKNKLTKKQIIHYIPCLIILITLLILILLKKLEQPGFNFSEIRAKLLNIKIVIYIIQLFLYSTLMVILLIQHNKNIKKFFSYSNKKINLTWLKIFLAIYITYWLADFLIHLIYQYDPPDSIHIAYLFHTIFFFVFLGYFSLKQERLYDETKILPEKLIKDIDITSEKKQEEKGTLKKDIKSTHIFSQLIDLVKKEELYKNPELSLFYLSKKLDINTTYLSYAINKESNTNFCALINNLRIEEAKKLLMNKDFDNYTVEAIANEVGFNHKQIFNYWFKKNTGITPWQYKNNKKYHKSKK